MSQPVSEGMEFKTRIQSMGAKGDGITIYKGLIIFVPGTEDRLWYKIRVVKVRDKCAFAEVVESYKTEEQAETMPLEPIEE